MQAWWCMKPSKRVYAVLAVSLLAILILSQTPVSAVDPPPSNLNVGPYVDKILYKVMPSQDQRILALQAGEIEMDNSFFDPVYLTQLVADPDVSIFEALRNGYGHITIDCRKYPTNISGLRRAFAFAFDKEAVTMGIMNGFSEEHDSLVPLPNSWCAEEEFDWHYYADRADIGNQILDDLGFEINVTTGFRHAPNGDPFNLTIGYASSSGIGDAVCQLGVDALHELHIDAQKTPADYNGGDLSDHVDLDMVFYASNFYSNDVTWLAFDYWSEYADLPDENPCNFANVTYDNWRDQLLYGTTYEEVYEAAVEMQKILHYNVPRLVVYVNTYLQFYRNDKFTGHVEDLGRYISGPWTMRKIHKLDGTFGGTVPIAIGQEPDSFNIYVTNSAYSAAILSELWPSLYTFGPDLNPWPDLAVNMLTETHSDNPAVQNGHTRFTVDIVQNATWSDGVPLTAQDVAFTFTYAFESTEFGNPAGTDIGDLFSAYAPTPTRAVIEFTTESYWHFNNFAYDFIIPEHIFNDDTGIGYEGWNTWNPVFNPAEPNVNCGPFIFTGYEAGEFYELTYNPRFHYRPVDVRPTGHQPVITLVPDISYIVGTTGHEITWFIDDDDADTYEVTMNDTLRESGSVNSSSISHNIDNLPLGNYTFVLTVFDHSGNYGTSTTHVYVLESIGNGPGWSPEFSILAISISSGSIVVILVATSAIVRTKRIQSATLSSE